MSGLFAPKIPAATAAPPVPTVDDAAARVNSADRMLRRGRATTVLTSDTGLPNLGQTRSPSATGG